MFTHVEHAGGGSGEDFKLQISQILQTFLQILYM